MIVPFARANTGVNEAQLGTLLLCLGVGDEQQVDEMAVRAAEKGILVAAPRHTGDGYYEAIIRDPDGNLIELIAE